MAALLERALKQIGYHVLSLDDAQSLLSLIQQQHPDLAFVDDLTVCRQLRENQYTLPLLFYSSHDSPQQVVQALDQGADDYIVVPFAREEFAARIRAQLRRVLAMRGGATGPPAPEMLQSRDGAICLNVATHRVSVHHREVHFTKTEFHLLSCFLRDVGKTLTYHFLLTTVWGSEYEGMEDYVRVYIRRRRAENRTGPEPSDLSSDATQPGICIRSIGGKRMRPEGKAGTRQDIVLFSWETIEELTQILATRILADGTPDMLVSLQRGGLIPTVLLSHQLAVSEMLTVPIRRTTSDAAYASKQAPILVLPEQVRSLTNQDVLIVDDIVGTGETLRMVRSALGAFRPRRLREAIYLVNLNHWEQAQDQAPEQEMTYIGQTIRAWAVFPWEKSASTLVALQEEAR
jgi:DNA-binding response OmpR family regulator/hypoxanthine phosphoribosyltransferase